MKNAPATLAPVTVNAPTAQLSDDDLETVAGGIRGALGTKTGGGQVCGTVNLFGTEIGGCVGGSGSVTTWG